MNPETDTVGNNPDDKGQGEKSQREDREYEKSGLYPDTGKPFRMWALFGWLTLLLALLAAISALLNFILI